uniref:NADH-ubiquinone oxidoreductase chain 3 n=1 Tax=Tyrophagus putrescentiae TaxID=59818 RepID=A0A0A7CE74_TYRPU|nr:NADH dehydrogenase subunit 3 [Tyrophagus putrescentiae]AIB08705.1 NADH dehydrogenase subunit 3 [Tyrophagus putrescentiae]QIA92560.1 NADH dehydrogenase subunit 3 [Tyrophagus putrescentiae]UNA71438.1 NADH dehydrogenase subunit 3 [Tyrophagus putrescentiae]
MKFFDYLLFSLFIAFLLIFLFFILSHWLSFSQEESSSAFECGFDSITPTGVPFSMPFFVISLMFLLFDVEILLVCFYPLFYSFTFYMFYIIWFTVLLVLLATLYEWYKGILSWL